MGQSQLFAAMVEEAGWSREDIDLFGQIGFGTGGWNTDYPNCFLEVLRVLYTGLDTNHKLMYDGSSELPTRLWNRAPDALGDPMAYWPAGTTVQGLTAQVIAQPFNQEVRQIIRRPDGEFDVWMFDHNRGSERQYTFAAVVYTPHKRVLDKFRFMDGVARFDQMNSLLSIKRVGGSYVHPLHAVGQNICADPAAFLDRCRCRSSIQDECDVVGPNYPRHIPAGLRCESRPLQRQRDVLSYTWNDDSIKFLGDRAAPLPSHVAVCSTLLDSVYAHHQLNLAAEFGMTDPFVEINWEEQPFFLSAFKMNLPGQYEYQRLLFSQFMNGVFDGSPDGFILAGDDVSFTGGRGRCRDHRLERRKQTGGEVRRGYLY